VPWNGGKPLLPQASVGWQPPDDDDDVTVLGCGVSGMKYFIGLAVRGGGVCDDCIGLPPLMAVVL
jgi:hypothetical protein